MYMHILPVMLSLYKSVVFGVLAVSMFMQLYFDAKVPEAIAEKWTVKIIDAAMKTYGHLVWGMSLVGNGSAYSHNSRQLADLFLLMQTTGSPWGLGEEPELKISDTLYGGVDVRVYEPVASLDNTRRPVVIYIHGGGWTLLSIDSYDPVTRKIAKVTGFVVISISYRLAPENPYPAALDDCLNVIEYVVENSQDLGLDSSRIAVAGDSAGGNLAAAVSLRMKAKVKLQLLLVPALQVVNVNTTGFIENDMYLSKSINNRGQFALWLNYAGIDVKYLPQFLSNNHTSRELKLSKQFERVNPDKLVPKYYIRTHALRNSEQRKDFGNKELWDSIKHRLLDPFFSPLMADDELLVATAQTYIMTAGYDIIRDDGIMYASRLKAAGVKVVIRNFPEAFHHAILFHDGPLQVNVGTRIMRDVTNFLVANL